MKLLIKLIFILSGPSALALDTMETPNTGCSEVIERIKSHSDFAIPMPMGGDSYISLSSNIENGKATLKLTSKNGDQLFHLYDKNSYCNIKSIEGDIDETYLEPTFTWNMRIVDQNGICTTKVPELNPRYVGRDIEKLKKYGFCISPDTLEQIPIIFGTAFFLPR